MHLHAPPMVEALIFDTIPGCHRPQNRIDRTHSPAGIIGTDAIYARDAARGRTGELRQRPGRPPPLRVRMSQAPHAPFRDRSRCARKSWSRSCGTSSCHWHGTVSAGLLINPHRGDTGPIQTAFFEAYAEAPQFFDNSDDLRCVNTKWWLMEGAERLSTELFGDKSGDHASPSEVSVAARRLPRSPQNRRSRTRTATFDSRLRPRRFPQTLPRGADGLSPATRIGGCRTEGYRGSGGRSGERIQNFPRRGIGRNKFGIRNSEFNRSRF